MKPTLKPKGKPTLAKPDPYLKGMTKDLFATKKSKGSKELAAAFKGLQELPPPKRFSSKWEEGSKDARKGRKASQCPYDEKTYDFVTWFNGWAFARHQMAIGDPPF